MKLLERVYLFLLKRGGVGTSRARPPLRIAAMKHLRSTFRAIQELILDEDNQERARHSGQRRTVGIAVLLGRYHDIHLSAMRAVLPDAELSDEAHYARSTLTVLFELAGGKRRCAVGTLCRVCSDIVDRIDRTITRMEWVNDAAILERTDFRSLFVPCGNRASFESVACLADQVARIDASRALSSIAVDPSSRTPTKELRRRVDVDQPTQATVPNAASRQQKGFVCRLKSTRREGLAEQTSWLESEPRCSSRRQARSTVGVVTIKALRVPNCLDANPAQRLRVKYPVAKLITTSSLPSLRGVDRRLLSETKQCRREESPADISHWESAYSDAFDASAKCWLQTNWPECAPGSECVP